ncbi:hypothetical protein LAD59_22515 [Klebsiella pneumoniae]|nr:hypothetical protein [Klebsiella pneumoniae]
MARLREKFGLCACCGTAHGSNVPTSVCRACLKGRLAGTLNFGTAERRQLFDAAHQGAAGRAGKVRSRSNSRITQWPLLKADISPSLWRSRQPLIHAVQLEMAQVLLYG